MPVIRKPFLRGISFPFRRGPSGFPAASADDDVVKDSLIRLLGTRKGERVMRPEYGTNIWNYLFESNTPAMAELMREEVYTAIGRFETRALVQDIVIERDDTTVTLTVYYINRITRRNQFVPIVFQNPVGG